MKKLLLTLMCVVAAVSAAFADVTYKQVPLSELKSGDEVVMVGTNNGNLYFATPTISSYTLQCVSISGSVEQSITLTDAEDATVQKFAVNFSDTKISLKKSGTENDYLKTGSFSGVSWATGETFLTPSNASGGGVFLKGDANVGFYKPDNVFYGVYANPANNTNYSGIYFFKAEALPSVYLSVGVDKIELQMVEGETVTQQMPTVTAILNRGQDDESVVPGLKYTYTAVKDNEGSGANEATDVFSVDADGVITALKAGFGFVKVELDSDEYSAEPLFLLVKVLAPKQEEYTGTLFKAGENSAFYFANINSYQTQIVSLSDGATETRKIEAGNYYILPTKGRDLTEVKVDGVAQKVYDYNSYFGSNYCMLNVAAGKEPREIVVNTTEPEGIKPTKFVVSGGGTVEIWRQDENYVTAWYATLKPDADGIAYVELEDNGGREYDIVAGEKSLLTEISYGSTTITSMYNGHSGMPSNYYFFYDTKQEYHVTCIPYNATTITFSIPTTDKADLYDSNGTFITNIGNSWQSTVTHRLEVGKTYYIRNKEGYELKSVTASNGTSPTIEQTANGQQAAFTVGETAVTYTIASPALPKEPTKLIFTSGRNVSIYKYSSNNSSARTLVYNYAEEEDLNTFDFDTHTDSYYYLVANKGYKLTSVVANPEPSNKPTVRNGVTPIVMADGKGFSSYCFLYKSWGGPISLTIDIEKVPYADFSAMEGSRAVLAHHNGYRWITDYTFNATNATVALSLELVANTDYYIFAVNGYALKEVLGDGTAMEISDCDESMPYATNYVMFNSNDAPASISINSPEKKIDVDPSTLVDNQIAGFDFTNPKYVFNLETGQNIESTSTKYYPAGTVFTDLAGTVQIELLNRQMSFIPTWETTPSYLYVGGAAGTNPAGALRFKFNDNASTFTKIEFTVASGYFTANTGNLLGTVWEPSAPSSAPSVNTVTATNGTSEVIFTAGAAVDLQKVTVTYRGPELPTGIETVEASANEVETVYYNLQGVRVQNPANGIYVRVRGNEVDKVMLK